jgi:predicted aspartyl protease
MKSHRENPIPGATRAPRTILRAAAVSIVVLAQGALAAAPAEDPILGAAPGSYRITAPDGVVRIPFKLHRGDILLEGGRVNGRDVRMMLDNGMLWDQLLFFGGPRVDSLALAYDGEIDVGGPGEGDAVKSRTASGIAISFPGVEFTGQSAVITPSSAGFADWWAGTEGQVSATFLKHFVVGIDFDQMIITLTEPRSFRYSGAGIEVPMKPIEGGYWAIPGTIELADGRRVALDLAMDLGYNDYLQIDPREANRLAAPERALEASLGFGAQGETRGSIGRVRAVEIGKYRLSDLLTGFVAPDDTGEVTTEALIGLGLFSRFNIVYDYPGHRMFLAPNRRFAEPFEHDMSGLVMSRGKDGKFLVDRVYPGSPADEAGLAAGDTVTKINGVESPACDRFELHDLFRTSGARVTLAVTRDGTERTISLTLRRPI